MWDKDSKINGAHSGSVLCLTSSESMVYSGGSDGVVNIWEQGPYFKLVKKYSVDIQDKSINSLNFKISSLNEYK